MGSLSQTFNAATHLNKGILAALGQILAVWVGGGTITPWGLIPVAAIAGVDSMDTARRNFLPVVIGLLATTVLAVILL